MTAGNVALGVLGSRKLDDYRVDEAIEKVIEEMGVSRIVTAYESDGVCRHARELAKKAGVELLLHPLPLDRGQGAYHWRTEAVIAAADRLLLVHDDAGGKEAENELRQVEKAGKPYDLRLMALMPEPKRPAALPNVVQVSRRRRR